MLKTAFKISQNIAGTLRLQGIIGTVLCSGLLFSDLYKKWTPNIFYPTIKKNVYINKKIYYTPKKNIYYDPQIHTFHYKYF